MRHGGKLVAGTRDSTVSFSNHKIRGKAYREGEKLKLMPPPLSGRLRSGKQEHPSHQMIPQLLHEAMDVHILQCCALTFAFEFTELVWWCSIAVMHSVYYHRYTWPDRVRYSYFPTMIACLAVCRTKVWCCMFVSSKVRTDWSGVHDDQERRYGRNGVESTFTHRL